MATDECAGSGDHYDSVADVIAACSAQKFLRRAVLSASRQIDAVMEVIVVDDAPSDEVCAVVEQFGQGCEKVILIPSAANGGPSVARNAGFAADRGDWTAVLDAA